MNEHNQIRITTLRWSFQSNLIFSISESKSSSIPLSALSLIMIFILSLFECVTRPSLLSLKEIRLIVTANWFFHVSNFLRSFMISFKYGLLLLRYSLTNSVLFLLLLLLYST